MRTRICPHCGGMMRWNYNKNAWICSSCEDTLLWNDYQRGQTRFVYTGEFIKEVPR